MISNNDNKASIVLIIAVIVFLLSLVAWLAVTIATIIHAFCNPDMTLTKVILWFIDKKFWIPIVTLIASYIVMIFFNERR